MKTIDNDHLAQVTGGAGLAQQTLEALQSKFGGGGWITMNGAPKVTPNANGSTISGSFKTEPWQAGNPSVNRSFNASAPKQSTWDQIQFNRVHVLPR